MVVSFGTRRPFGHEPVEPSAGVIISGGKRNIGASSGRHKAYFKAETQSPVFRDLQQLFEKTAGLAPILEQILKPFGNKGQSAFIYGSVARSREHAMSDVDVMVIGRAGLADLSPALRKAEERLGREVNVTAYSPEEFREKIKSRTSSLTELRKPYSSCTRCES